MPRPKPATTDFDEMPLAAAAAYLACSASTFRRAVAVGLVPKPTPRLGGNRWVRCDLDEARREFAAHPAKWRSRLAAQQRTGRKPNPSRRPAG